MKTIKWKGSAKTLLSKILLNKDKFKKTDKPPFLEALPNILEKDFDIIYKNSDENILYYIKRFKQDTCSYWICNIFEQLRDKEIPFEQIYLKTDNILLTKLWDLIKWYYTNKTIQIYDMLLNESLEDWIILENDQFYFKITDWVISKIKDADISKTYLAKGSFKGAYKVWSNRLKKWLILKQISDFTEIDLIYKNHSDLFPKLIYKSDKFIIQELLYPYYLSENPKLLLQKEKELEIFFKELPLGYKIDKALHNWGWEILGWENEQKTIPRLGQLKNFDPLYK
jgi:hypothetical protein